MKLLKRVTVVFLALLALAVPAFSYAEGDYETGDGWTYRDGELTILSNQGLANFLYYEEVLSDASHEIPVSNVDRVVIGKDVTDIAINDYIYNYSPSDTTVEEGNQTYVIDNGWVVNKATKTLFGAANVKQNQKSSVIGDLPTFIEHIGMYAFNNCSALKSISIPSGFVSIGEFSFNNCDSLESVALPSTVASIGVGAFNHCTSLNHINIGPNVKEIGAAAFDACIRLETPSFQNMQLDTIYGNSFWGCDTFQTVEFSPSLRLVENQAFAHCSNLTSLIFHSDQLILENGAFDACENVRKLVFTQGAPISIGRSLFGEDERTPDGKSFITRLYDSNGKVIPYPTLYYTAAYVAAWAPNGETEWNGYPIQQISQEELDAILAEAHGEEAPVVSASPVPTETQQTESPAAEPESAWSEGVVSVGRNILILFTAKFSAAITVLLASKIKNCRNKKNAPKENKPTESKRGKKIIKKLLCWLAGILCALFIFLSLISLAGVVDLFLNDGNEATESGDRTCVASVTEYVDPVTAEKSFDILVNAPSGSVVRLIAQCEFQTDRVTIDSSDVVLMRVNQKAFLPNTPLESDTAQITPKIEVTFPSGEVVQPSLPSSYEKVPVLDIFVTDPAAEAIEIPVDQQTVRIAGHTDYSNDIPVYVNNEQVYVDEAGNFEYFLDLTQLDDAEITVTVEARRDNCKTARKTITIHRIPAESTKEKVMPHDLLEKGSGWTFQNGLLTITANGGFEAYFEEVDNPNRAKEYQNEPYMVDSVVIEKNVTEFSMFPFGTDFYPTQMIVEEGNTQFVVMDGWLVNRKTNTLICATDLDHFEWMSSVRTIPDVVQYIGHDAFYPLNCVLQICLPNSVIGIEDDAFNGCGGLQSIELPSSVQRIGKSAFNYCTSLENVVLSSSVDTIDEEAFYSCYSLAHINLKDTQITELNSHVFSLSGLKEIVLPDTLQTIKRDAFSSCWYLESVIVCSDLIVINDGAFSECDQLKTILFTKGVPAWIGSRLFDETGKTADGTCFFSNSMDADGKPIPYPTLLYTAEYADEWAPNGETKWNGYPIRQMNVEEAKSLPVRSVSQSAAPVASCADSGYEAGNGWIFQDGTLRLTANEGLEDFTNNKPDENFKWRHTHFPDQVEYIEIGKGVSSITPFASYRFWYFSPKEIRIAADNPNFVNVNGWIIQKETETLIGPGNLETFRGPIEITGLPDSIRAIGESACNLACLPYWYFDPERALVQKVDFPKELQTIGEDAFYDCDELLRLDLPAKLTTIGDSAFRDCMRLKQIQFGPAIRSIGEKAFYNCSDLPNINLEDTKITVLRDSAFGSCDALNTAMLPETLKTIETDAFDYCTSLQTLVFFSDAVTIQSGAFRDCIGVKEMIFMKGVPAKLEDALFGEEEKASDRKGYISCLYDRDGTVIPYPTLYYTAAYADEWAPNGETEWNGYPIQQISQEELDAIFTEVRGEDASMASATPLPTEAPQTETPAPDESNSKPALVIGIRSILFFEICILAIVFAVIAILRSRKAKK